MRAYSLITAAIIQAQKIRRFMKIEVILLYIVTS